jgi:hypothetical protein
MRLLKSHTVPQRKQPTTITKISRLMLFKEIATVHSENHVKSINKLCVKDAELLVVRASDAYTYH